MAAYLIAEVKVTDQSWIPDYVKHLHGLVAKHVASISLAAQT
jgi:uncharacterized protein (DUF1330 family)